MNQIQIEGIERLKNFQNKTIDKKLGIRKKSSKYLHSPPSRKSSKKINLLIMREKRNIKEKLYYK